MVSVFGQSRVDRVCVCVLAPSMIDRACVRACVRACSRSGRVEPKTLKLVFIVSPISSQY